MKRNILITGAGKGIGFECVKILSTDKENFIYALVRSKSDLNKFKKIKNVIAFAGNVNNDADINKIFNHAKINRVIINCLINNAGIRQRKNFLGISKKDIREVFQTNFFSIFHIMQIFSKNLIKKKKPGKIINIGSIVGNLGFKQLSGYAATKMALIGLTKSFSVEMAKHNISANVINPGFTKTSFYKKFKSKKKLYNWTLQRIPMKRWGEPLEIAKLVEFLISDQSSYINGEEINIDGGWTNA